MDDQRREEDGIVQVAKGRYAGRVDYRKSGVATLLSKQRHLDDG